MSKPDSLKFEALVAAAIDRLPDQLRPALDDTPVLVANLGSDKRVYGDYFGDTLARSSQPDRIVLYRDTLERDFGHDRALLFEHIERTIRHELGRHLGKGDRGMGGLGL